MNLDAILERAGIRLSDEDRERLARTLPFYELQLAALRIPEARYEEPAVIHDLTR
jgi:hypothetical protein